MKLLSIYLILMFSMFFVVLGIDWYMGYPPSVVLRRSFYGFFRYVDKVEYVVTIFLLCFPILSFIWAKWTKKKQSA